MSIRFGAGTLTLFTDGIGSGVTVTTATTSATNSRTLQVATGSIWIEGVEVQVSATTVAVTEGADTNTGSGLLIYAYLDTGSTTTGSLTYYSASDARNTATNRPTAIASLARFSFGTAANAVSTIGATSTYSAVKAIGRLQSVNVNINAGDPVILRDGNNNYPLDIKFADASIDGSFSFADPTSTQHVIFGGLYATGGAGSGTWTLSGTSRPEPFMIRANNITDGITGTLTLFKCYATTISKPGSRAEHSLPEINFIAMANKSGSVAQYQGS